MENNLSGIDSLVLFQNSQGQHGRGTLIHITRTQAVIEVYNPYSIVQISEVLASVKIIRGERMIYHGKAVVTNIVTTGLMIIVSCSLTDAWSDLSGLLPGHGLEAETRRFVNDWQASHRLRPGYQLVVSTMRSFLGELSHWLAEAEATVLDEDAENQNDALSLAEDFYRDIRSPVMPKIVDLITSFEREAAAVPEDLLTVHKSFARRELHPLTMCSPFVHRTYTKPLGYAGDYEMVNMMLGTSETQPHGTYAKITHALYIQAAAPQAHRNRIDMLTQRLNAEAERMVQAERPLTILNVGCGPAVEVRRFIRDNPLADYADFTLMDFNEETLAHTEAKIQETLRESGRRTTVRFIQKSIDDLLQEAYQNQDAKPASYELVYCAGLFDYFSDRICRRLVELFCRWVQPQGHISVTNVHPSNPNRHQMEHLLEWYLVYRNEADMRALAPPGVAHEIEPDATGVNVFLDLYPGGRS